MRQGAYIVPCAINWEASAFHQLADISFPKPWNGILSNWASRIFFDCNHRWRYNYKKMAWTKRENQSNPICKYRRQKCNEDYMQWCNCLLCKYKRQKYNKFHTFHTQNEQKQQKRYLGTCNCWEKTKYNILNFIKSSIVSLSIYILSVKMLTLDPRRTSTGKLRPQCPPQDWMQPIRRNASLDISISFLELVQLSQFPAEIIFSRL